MRSFLTAIFVFLISFTCSAGDSVAVKPKRLAIGIIGSPDRCERATSLSGYSTSNDRPLIAFTAGVNARYMITDNFFTSVGLQYSIKGWQTTGYTTSWGSISQIFDVRHQYNYAELPIAVGLMAGQKKMRFILQGGVTPALLLHERSIKIYENGDRAKTAFNYLHNPVNLFVNVGIGAEFIMGKKCSLQILPTANYGMFATITNPWLGSEVLYNAGLRLGLHFTL